MIIFEILVSELTKWTKSMLSDLILNKSLPVIVNIIYSLSLLLKYMSYLAVPIYMYNNFGIAKIV